MRFKIKIKNEDGQLKLWFDAILATAFIFFMILGIFSLSAFKAFDILDPIGEALEDFEFTDYVFSELRPQPPADTNIVMVNLGPASGGRGLIAEIIRIVDKYDPAVIGIDSFFRRPNPNDPEADSILQSVLSHVENLVLVSGVQGYDSVTNTFTQFEYSHEMFMENAETAIANLETGADNQQDSKVVRRFPPKRSVGDKQEIAFGVQLVNYLYPDKVNRFLERDNKFEIINYRGNIVDPHEAGAPKYGNRFYSLDYIEVLTENFVTSLIKDKIVIAGYLGDDMLDTNWDDKFYTPINKKTAGKANPDMYGAVVHANIAAMVINEDYVNTLSNTQSNIIAVLLCYVNVLLFIIIYRRLPKWYDGMTKLIQLIEALIIIFIVVYFFHLYNLKLELTLAIIAVLLSGDLIEVYNGVLKNLFNREQRKLLFKPRSNEINDC